MSDKYEGGKKDKAKISRRALLTTMGVAGAGLAAASFLNDGEHRHQSSVFAGGLGVIAMTMEQLREQTTATEGQVVFITNQGKEGHFIYDPQDVASVDNDEDVIVSAHGFCYKRLAPEMHYDRRQMKAELSLDMFNASGSSRYTTGSIQDGSKELHVDSPIDFRPGQGILIAGAGGIAKEVLALIIESDANLPGKVTLSLPGEESKVAEVVAKKEVVELQITSSCEFSGQVALVLDTVEFLIPVNEGESSVQIVDRIRDWYFEGWTNGGDRGSDRVEFTAIESGRQRDARLYSNGTGVTGTLKISKGAALSAHEIVTKFKSMKYENWETGGYNYANVVFFISKKNGAMQGQEATVSFSETDAYGRIDVAQFGAFFLSQIESISGNTITLTTASNRTVSNVYVGHDDTVALTQALVHGAGRTIYIPEGTYRLTRKLTPMAGTVIRGAGQRMTALQFQALGTFVEIGENSPYVSIGYLEIRNACAPDAYYGGNDTEIHGVQINGARGVVVEHCRFDNCDDAGISVRGHAFGAKLLYNTIVNTSEGSGIEIIRTNECLMIGNIIQFSSQHAIRLCGAQKPIAIANIMEKNRDGFSIQGYGNGINVTQRTQDFIIEGNTIKDHVSYAIGIFNQVNSGIIAGNWLEGTEGQLGISFRHVTIAGRKSTNFDITVEGNMIKGFTAGIHLGGDQHHIVIKGNTIKDFSADGNSQAYGIDMDTAGTGDLRGIVIDGNTFISKVANMCGVRLYRATPKSTIQVHHNTFMMRISQPDANWTEEYAIKRMPTSGSNTEALVSMAHSRFQMIGTSSAASTEGMLKYDTNIYEVISV